MLQLAAVSTNRTIRDREKLEFSRESRSCDKGMRHRLAPRFPITALPARWWRSNGFWGLAWILPSSKHWTLNLGILHPVKLASKWEMTRQCQTQKALDVLPPKALMGKHPGGRTQTREETNPRMWPRVVKFLNCWSPHPMTSLAKTKERKQRTNYMMGIRWRGHRSHMRAGKFLPWQRHIWITIFLFRKKERINKAS